MITEDYVTFKQAKTLKKLGFPQDKNSDYLFYDEEGSLRSFHISSTFKLQFKRLSLSLVQKWLREEKGLDIDINSHKELLYKYYTVYLPIRTDYILDTNNRPIHFETYEQALSTGIDKYIELLKMHK